MLDFDENWHFNHLHLHLYILSWCTSHWATWNYLNAEPPPHIGQCLPIPCCWSDWGLWGKRFVRVIDVKQNLTAPSSFPSLSYATYYCLSWHPGCSLLFVNNNCTLLVDFYPPLELVLVWFLQGNNKKGSVLLQQVLYLLVSLVGHAIFSPNSQSNPILNSNTNSIQHHRKISGRSLPP